MVSFFVCAESSITQYGYCNRVVKEKIIHITMASAAQLSQCLVNEVQTEFK